MEENKESFLDKAKDTLSDLKEKAGDAWDKAKDTLEDAWDATKEKAGELKEDIQEKIADVRGQGNAASDAVDDASAAAKKAGKDLSSKPDSL